MKVYSVTGTNGKTTVAWIIRYLVSCFKPCGYIGTIGYMWDENIHDSFYTTPEVCEIHRMIKEIYDHNCRDIAIEASSQGIELRRIDSVDFDYAIFTNLTHDHLDVHGTMDNYYNAKAILFRKLTSDKTAVINIDDAYLWDTRCRPVVEMVPELVDIQALNPNGKDFTIEQFEN